MITRKSYSLVRSLCMLIIVCIIMSFSAAVSAAQVSFAATVDKTTVYAGDEITVTVAIETEMVDNFCSANFSISYDTAAFEAVSATVSEEYSSIPDIYQVAAGTGTPGLLQFSTVANLVNLSVPADCVFATYVLKVKEGAPVGIYSLNFADDGYAAGEYTLQESGLVDHAVSHTVTVTGAEVEVRDLLSDLREEVIAEINAEYDKYTSTDYTEEGWEELTDIKDDAIAEINAATTEEDINRIKDEAIAAMAAVEKAPDDPGPTDPTDPTDPAGPTTGGIGGGGSTQTLADVKKEATEELDDLIAGLSLDDYSEEEWAELEKIIEDAKTAIDDAKGKNSVNTIKEEALAEFAAALALAEGDGIPIDETIVPEVIPAPEVTDEQLAQVEELYIDMAGHWARSYIYKLSLEDEIFKGKGDGIFAPDIGITRQEIAVALGRLLGFDEEAAAISETTYTDNSEIADWAKGYISVMSREGILLGNADGSFAPTKVITREQLALILSRMLEKPEAVAALTFDDTDEISDWAAEGCAIAYTYGVIKGYPDNTFRGTREVTRSEAATMIYNYINVK